MKRTKRGTDLSDIGTTQLHIKHDVQIEGLESGLARAKVKDQMVIDALLLDDVITIAQHAEAERLLNLAQRAGVFLRSVDMGGVMGGSGRGDLANTGFMRWRYAINGIRRSHGVEGVKVVQDCILENHKGSEGRTELLIKVLSRE